MVVQLYRWDEKECGQERIFIRSQPRFSAAPATELKPLSNLGCILGDHNRSGFSIADGCKAVGGCFSRLWAWHLAARDWEAQIPNL